MTPTLICINTSAVPTDEMKVPLIMNACYPEQASRTCTCGVKYVDVGFRLDPARYFITCGCGRKMQDGIWWFDAKRFRRPEQSTQGLEITLTETITRSVTIKLPSQ
jgi:hypothetical protein